MWAEYCREAGKSAGSLHCAKTTIKHLVPSPHQRGATPAKSLGSVATIISGKVRQTVHFWLLCCWLLSVNFFPFLGQFGCATLDPAIIVNITQSKQCKQYFWGFASIPWEILYCCRFALEQQATTQILPIFTIWCFGHQHLFGETDKAFSTGKCPDFCWCNQQRTNARKLSINFSKSTMQVNQSWNTTRSLKYLSEWLILTECCNRMLPFVSWVVLLWFHFHGHFLWPLCQMSRFSMSKAHAIRKTHLTIINWHRPRRIGSSLSTRSLPFATVLPWHLIFLQEAINLKETMLFHHNSFRNLSISITQPRF